MTVNLHEMNDEQFERLLKLTGSRLSMPPMRDIVATTLAGIRTDRAATQTSESTPLHWNGVVDERIIRRIPMSRYASFVEPPRSRWKDLGVFAGGVGAAAFLTLLLVFRGFGADDSSRDAGQSQAPPAAAFADPALAASTLLVQSLADTALLTNTVVLPIDPATGAPVPGYAPIPGEVSSFAPAVTTSDGKVYFASFESHGRVCEPMSGGSACRGSADVLHLVEATTWTDRTATLAGDSWVNGDAFSPDGLRYAVVLSSSTMHRLLLFDTATAGLIAERELDFRPSLVTFAVDGTALIVFGQRLGEAPGTDQPGPPQLLRLDAATLETVWEHSFEDMKMGSWCVSECSGPHENRESVSWDPGVSIAPDGGTLVAVHADREVLTRVDLATEDVRELELHSDAAWYDRLAGLLIAEAEAKGTSGGAHRETAWTPDGSRLYVLTIAFNATRQLDDDTAVLQALDPESGRIIQERAIVAAAYLTLSPDTGNVFIEGRRALSSNDDSGRWTTVFDAESFEPIAELDQWQVEVLHTLDGRPILLAQRGDYDSAEPALLDAETYAVVSSWPVAPGQCYVSAQEPICKAP